MATQHYNDLPPLPILRGQLCALEMLYAGERRCDEARKLLDLASDKRDEIALAERLATALVGARS